MILVYAALYLANKASILAYAALYLNMIIARRGENPSGDEEVLGEMIS